MSHGLGKTVAIVGAGALGLVATKNLIEEGFEVSTFERNSYVGGLWHATEDATQTSVFPGTRAIVSKQHSCYSDFPYAEHVLLHPSAKEQQEYLESYARHFDLYRNIQLSTIVLRVCRDEEKRKWIITTQPIDDAETLPTRQCFDRLVIATGANSRPTPPSLKGSEHFAGSIVHSQQVKNLVGYEGKTILVVGVSATAADVIRSLIESGAKKIYVSHTRTPNVLPLTVGANALDHLSSWRQKLQGARLAAEDAEQSALLTQEMFKALREQKWPGLTTSAAFGNERATPSMVSTLPFLSDMLGTDLLDGSVESVMPIAHISGPRAITLIDKKQLMDVESIICCTGSTFTTSGLVQPTHDPGNPVLAPDNFSAYFEAPHYRRQNAYLRLYRNFLSLQSPHSLAFLGHAIYNRPAFYLYDLVTMALAQIWSGKSALPSSAEMEAWCNTHYDWLVSELHKGPVQHTGLITTIEHDMWMQEIAGTGVFDNLSNTAADGNYGNEHIGGARNLRRTDLELYDLLMDGVESPHVLRLFATGRGRKTWPGAREAIEKANMEVQELKQA